ncbi:MAG TPA: hypothetical protein VD859_05670 [Nocardioides sp.]|nr:hypothetical protein [Nocardioides sp.]
MSTTDYCDLCDLPKSQCVHGMPPLPEPVKKAAPPPKPRPKPVSRSRTPDVAAAPVARRWTQPELFKPFIIEILDEAGGALEADEMFEQLEARTSDLFLSGDQEKTPQGELRWHAAARRARVALIDEGRMVRTKPGVWQLR